ncbi:hypothetical protein M8998_07025 [Sphingobacterium sp. lm-10]|uniref:hypothetical protein n=1 Tax=Sphingobacterium sp. lm-10 TaxID=2944904 RepID=UPI002020957D|nr:hypothetical protein [Sphingobacterium sp. lm-10]MCL7987684.1 hypothetical protein [Sphingobacterium sp. lm-10]MCL7987686.1 hypothetical protein [Sphingobacterium sp. lm-10]
MPTLTKFEILLINKLKQGQTQRYISEEFYAEGIKPHSLSSIEKHLVAIRAKFGAKMMFHLEVLVGPV